MATKSATNSAYEYRETFVACLENALPNEVLVFAIAQDLIVTKETRALYVYIAIIYFTMHALSIIHDYSHVISSCHTQINVK